MHTSFQIVFSCLIAVSFLDGVVARNIHQSSGGLRRGAARHTFLPSKLRDDLRTAVASALGEGHDTDPGHLEHVKQKLSPTWRSLAKNEQGRVDRRSLRYAVHRYFLQTYSLSIVGLEPAHISSDKDEAVLLTEFAPNYVRAEIEGKAAQSGFSLEDLVTMIVTLERLVLDSGKELLQKAWNATGNSDLHSSLTRNQVIEVLEAYMLRWMLGEDTEGLQELEADRNLLEESLDDWDEIDDFLHGELTSFEHKQRHRAHSHGSASSWNPLKRRYSFEDVDSVIGQVTMGFGRFWETECVRVKGLLTDMDRNKNGRVKLTDFYAAAMGGEWRFSESKDYLKQLGALDESQSWQGPQVIITNYMQAASNCIVSAPHYRVCCMNECEDILDEIEEVVNGPLGSPEVILAVLENHTVTLDDRHMQLSASLRKQLGDIAEASPGGKVPLHGRLFAQWLHYAFPQECPFPHKQGTTVALTPNEFGEKYLSSEEEMATHASDAHLSGEQAQEIDGESDWMSQWSHEEELLSDHTHLHAPWEPRLPMSSTVVGILVFAVGAGIAYSKVGAGHAIRDGPKDSLLPTRGSMKIHSC